MIRCLSVFCEICDYLHCPHSIHSRVSVCVLVFPFDRPPVPAWAHMIVTTGLLQEILIDFCMDRRRVVGECGQCYVVSINSC